MVDAEETVTCMTTKEIKALARPEFAKNPEKFYPVTTLTKLGFSRTQCPKCKNNYWRHSEKAKTCGDSNCDGKYSFIGKGSGKGKKITYAEAWKGFEESLTSTRIPCTSIKRYPVVARWRNDVDYVAAGIFCFQPYCVTGELDPPANPLIMPQFCLRFNDLDNIGITGRHYSGFIMVGIQVFNTEGNYKFFKEEAVEFNFRWLTETLGVHPDEITFVEDVWAGGGNLGPSIEYFVGGLEVGNMVFIQYKTFHDGTREELDVKVIDTGIGLERIVWLYNGSATSYTDTFKNAMEYFQEQVGIEIDQEVWNKFGPYSCTLNIDEVDDIEETWKDLAKKIDMPVQQVKDGIQTVKEMYIILDHTRSILLAISDGSLPSNVGGGGNVRNIFRRTLALLKKNGWWEKLGMEGYLKIYEMHKKDLEGIFGPFPEYKSFDMIIKVEYDRWLNTDAEQGEKLKKLIKKNKNTLTLDDWITAMQSWGIAADKISEVAGTPIPGNLYYEIAMRQERVAKKPEQILYNTIHLPETKSLYFDDTHLYQFDAEIIDVYANVRQDNKRNLVILDQSCFYPTSGGQIHDIGKLTIKRKLTAQSSIADIQAVLEEHGAKRGIDEFDMLDKVTNQIDKAENDGAYRAKLVNYLNKQAGGTEYNVIDCIKVGKVVMHVVDNELSGDVEAWKGCKVHGEIDQVRRAQLQAHHTGTHLIFASCKKVLGPHVWQAGAKKTTEQAHLDITHYKSITAEEEQEIENTANRLINDCVNVEKGFMDKSDAEKIHGFSLYQGGIVPGNSLRVVNIEGVDVEACCGTHADNTAEVGWVRILKSQRISDGIVRLTYVAQERAIDVLTSEAGILTSLQKMWGVGQTDLEKTASKFFSDCKRLNTQTERQDQQILKLQVQSMLKDTKQKTFYVKSEQPDPTLYITWLPQYAEEMKKGGKGVVFLASNFVVGLFGDPSSIKIDELKAVATDLSSKEVKVMNKDKVSFKFKEKGKKPINVTGVCQFMISGANMNVDKLAETLEGMAIQDMDGNTASDVQQEEKKAAPQQSKKPADAQETKKPAPPQKEEKPAPEEEKKEEKKEEKPAGTKDEKKKKKGKK